MTPVDAKIHSSTTNAQKCGRTVKPGSKPGAKLGLKPGPKPGTKRKWTEVEDGVEDPSL